MFSLCDVKGTSDGHRRGLDVALLASPKLFLVEADAAQERLGLPTETYIEVSSRRLHTIESDQSTRYATP
jgi:hypothetical protein